MRRAMVVAALFMCAGEAAAARRHFTWVGDTDVNPQRGVELEWWAWEHAGYIHSDSALLAAAVVGLTDNIELAVPLEIIWHPNSGGQLWYGLDLRWRLAPADPARSGPLVPLVRVGAWRLPGIDAVRIDGDVVLSLDLHDLRLVADAGLAGTTRIDQLVATFGGGASYALTSELRIGAEVYSEVTLRPPEDDEAWISAGPSLSFTHGRFWIAASLLFGLDEDAPDFLPRAIWGTAF